MMIVFCDFIRRYFALYNFRENGSHDTFILIKNPRYCVGTNLRNEKKKDVKILVKFKFHYFTPFLGTINIIIPNRFLVFQKKVGYHSAKQFRPYCRLLFPIGLWREAYSQKFFQLSNHFRYLEPK